MQVIERATLDTMKGTLRVVKGNWHLAYDLIDLTRFRHFNVTRRSGDDDTSVEDAVEDELSTIQCDTNLQASWTLAFLFFYSSTVPLAAGFMPAT